MQQLGKVGVIPLSGKVIEFSMAGEDDERHFCVAQHRQFTRLLQQSASTLRESHLPVCTIFNPLYLYLFAAHSLFSSRSVYF